MPGKIFRPIAIVAVLLTGLLTVASAHAAPARSEGLAVQAFTSSMALVQNSAPVTTMAAIPMAAPTSTRYCSTGGYAYETDTFYNTRRWDSYYGQYTFTTTWGANRSVKSGGKTYVHKLESIRIRYSGKNVLITRFDTVNAARETYWLNTSKAKFTYTTRITDKSAGRTWYRACTVTF